MPGNLFGQLLAVLPPGARHRHQILHGRMGLDLSGADVPLHGLGQFAHQRKPARYPRHAAVKPAGQIVQTQSLAAMQLGQQPGLFQRRFPFRRAQRSVQYQRFGFVHVPDRGANRVPLQPLECPYPLVTVNDQKPVRFAVCGYNDDGNLLPPFSQ
jgi:hypothetical protein